jgi:hypothetical protein
MYISKRIVITADAAHLVLVLAPADDPLLFLASGIFVRTHKQSQSSAQLFIFSFCSCPDASARASLVCHLERLQ